MNLSTKSLSLLAAVFFIASSAFGNNATNYFNTGLDKGQAGKFDEALTNFSKAIESNPDFVEAYNERGLIKRTKGDLDGAIIDYMAVQL